VFPHVELYCSEIGQFILLSLRPSSARPRRARAPVALKEDACPHPWGSRPPPPPCAANPEAGPQPQPAAGSAVRRCSFLLPAQLVGWTTIGSLAAGRANRQFHLALFVLSAAVLRFLRALRALDHVKPSLSAPFSPLEAASTNTWTRLAFGRSWPAFFGAASACKRGAGGPPGVVGRRRCV